MKKFKNIVVLSALFFMTVASVLVLCLSLGILDVDAFLLFFTVASIGYICYIVVATFYAFKDELAGLYRKILFEFKFLKAKISTLKLNRSARELQYKKLAILRKMEVERRHTPFTITNMLNMLELSEEISKLTKKP